MATNHKLLANIQKKWFELCFKILKSLKDKYVYEIIDLLNTIKYSLH